MACTEQEWDAGVKDGKPLAEVRREQGYTLGDESIKVYRRTKTGKLQRLSARQLEARVAKAFISTSIGSKMGRSNASLRRRLSFAKI